MASVVKGRLGAYLYRLTDDRGRAGGVLNGQDMKSSSQGSPRQPAPQHDPRSQTAAHDIVATENSSPAIKQSLEAIAAIQEVQIDVLKLPPSGAIQGWFPNQQGVSILRRNASSQSSPTGLDRRVCQDNIKAARKEAIRRVYECISVLEAKPGSSVLDQPN